MGRESRKLDGIWDFQFYPGYAQQPAKQAGWREIEVPFPWQAQFDDLREATGTGWYRRWVNLPARWLDYPLVLHVGAAYYHLTAWVNGVCVGEHADGYLPAEFSISPYLHADGPNELLLRVVAPGDNRREYPDFPFSEIPHGKQSWYGPIGGVWQSVFIECRPTVHITALHLAPNLATNSLSVDVELTETAKAHLYIISPQGETVAETTVTGKDIRAELPVHSPQLWSPDNPNLYRLVCDVQPGNDQIEKTFGFRQIETRDGQLYLNGKPFYLRGALDQDYYLDTLTTPPSVAFLEDQLRKAKQMGLNCLRYHIKLADPRYYEVADRLGMLLWVDFPNWLQLTDAVKERVRSGFERMLQRDHHHPSIGIWTIVNEDWGTDLTINPDHREWLREMTKWLRALDPTRLVVDNSPCEPNFHMDTDINDYHFYRAIPEQAKDWEQTIEAFASRSYRTHSPHGDAIETEQEPLVVSEFGAWGLPNIANLRDPWWFETGDNWGDGVAYPHGVLTRFRRYYMHRWFGSWEALAAATQTQQFCALQYQIETMRLQPTIRGYVITEFTDTHWECNGLLDMAREPKVFHQAMAYLNADTLLIPRLEHSVFRGGASVDLPLFVSHEGEEALDDVRLIIQQEEHPVLETSIAHIGRGQVTRLTNVTLSLPDCDQPKAVDYTLRLEQDGRVIAKRNLTLFVCPELQQTDRTLFVADERLEEFFMSLGWRIAAHPSDADVIITTRIDANLIQQIAKGATMLLVVQDEQAIPDAVDFPAGVLPRFPQVTIVPRQQSIYAGDWVSAFSWLVRDGAFRSIPGGILTDHQFNGITPEYVLSGFAPYDFEANVAAGIFVGWLHNMRAITARRFYGHGVLGITTWRFRITPDDVFSSYLARSLLDWLCE